MHSISDDNDDDNRNKALLPISCVDDGDEDDGAETIKRLSKIPKPKKKSGEVIRASGATITFSGIQNTFDNVSLLLQILYLCLLVCQGC